MIRLKQLPLLLGLAAAVVVLLFHLAGWFAPLERWCHDQRARHCQFFSPGPSGRIAHLDIDDASLEPENLGRWPWPRSWLAEIVTECHAAGAKVIVLDVTLDRPERVVYERVSDNSVAPVDHDAALGQAIARSGNVIVPIAFSHEADTQLARAVREQVQADPAITLEQLAARLAGRQSSADAAHLPAMLESARKSALLDWLLGQFRRSRREALPIQEDWLMQEATVRFTGLARESIAAQYARAVSLDALARRTIEPAAPLPWISRATGMRPPVPAVSRSALVGAVDFFSDDDGIVRSVPLAVEQRGRVYLQLGLVAACQLLDVAPDEVELAPDRITLRKPGGEIVVPLRSGVRGRAAAGMMFDVPWRGPRRWESMYPARADGSSAHLPVTLAWNAVKLRRAIDKNRPRAALALADLQAAMERCPDCPVAIRPDQVPGIQHLLGHSAPASNMLRDSEKARAAAGALQVFVDQQRQFADAQSILRRHLTDKAVFIGFVASDLRDSVPTSLHNDCPGVVIHGLIAESILQQHLWRAAPAWVAAVVVLLAGLAAIAPSTRFRPLVSAVFILLLLAGWLLIDGIVLFDWADLLVPAAAPAVAITGVWAVCTSARLAREILQRVKASSEAAAWRREMELARGVQQSLIPAKLPVLEGFDIRGWMQPASLTGGDCYDLWTMPDARVGILVADAAGHGLASCMIVAQARSLIRALAEIEPDPRIILQRASARLHADLRSGQFVTAFLGLLSPDGWIDWASAGQGPILYRPGPDANWQELAASGPPLGILPQWESLDSPGRPVLEAGGMLIVLSDGLHEAPNASGERLGIARLVESLVSLGTASSAQAIEGLRQRSRQWCAGGDLPDDQTIVAIRRGASKPSSWLATPANAPQPIY